MLSFLSLCIIYKCTCIGMVCLPMFPPEKCFNCDTAGNFRTVFGSTNHVYVSLNGKYSEFVNALL